MLLVVGYVVALVVLTRARAVLRERRWRWFGALELATGSVIAGYALVGNGMGVILNVLNLIGFALVWGWTGSRAS